MVNKTVLKFILLSTIVFVDCLLAYPKGKDTINFISKFDFSNPSKAEVSGIVRIHDPVVGTICTAFVVDNNYAITAAHCLNGLGRITSRSIFVSANYKAHLEYIEVKAAGYDSRNDVGVLVGNFSSFKPLKVNFTKKSYEFSDMTACGYAEGKPYYICKKLETTGRVLHLIRAWGKVIPGMSGGPAIDNKTGEVVAIISEYDKFGYSYVVPLKEFIASFPALR